MPRLNRRQFLETSCLAAGACVAGGSFAFGAIAPGVETVAAPMITGEEQNTQRDIWALEVNYKPVRMIHVDLTDPKTGKSAKRLVWYLAYRAVVRPTSNLADDTVGASDRPIFVPELTLVSEIAGRQLPYPDRVIPEVQAAINKRERHNYKNSVEIVGPLPPITPERAKVWKSLDGIATWTGVNPDTDNFTVYMTGFSNGYQVNQGPNGEQIVLRRTLAQKFWRPSDRFDQSEDEIRLKDDPKWIYR
ncbi:MAG: twin-arginine translocation signal domain-containing protein [Planctomycetaceae bacterium]